MQHKNTRGAELQPDVTWALPLPAGNVVEQLCCLCQAQREAAFQWELAPAFCALAQRSFEDWACLILHWQHTPVVETVPGATRCILSSSSGSWYNKPCTKDVDSTDVVVSLTPVVLFLLSPACLGRYKS